MTFFINMAVRATLVATVAIDPVQAERRVRNFFTHFAFMPDLKIWEKCFFCLEGIKIFPNCIFGIMWRNRFSIFISKFQIWYINNRTRDLSLNYIILLIFSHILTSICVCSLFLPGSQLSLKHPRRKNRLVPNFQHPVSSEIHTVTFQLLYHT